MDSHHVDGGLGTYISRPLEPRPPRADEEAEPPGWPRAHSWPPGRVRAPPPAGEALAPGHRMAPPSSCRARAKARSCGGRQDFGESGSRPCGSGVRPWRRAGGGPCSRAGRRRQRTRMGNVYPSGNPHGCRSPISVPRRRHHLAAPAAARRSRGVRPQAPRRTQGSRPPRATASQAAGPAAAPRGAGRRGRRPPHCRRRRDFAAALGSGLSGGRGCWVPRSGQAPARAGVRMQVAGRSASRACAGVAAGGW
jgi:hypothetical protein